MLTFLSFSTFLGRLFGGSADEEIEKEFENQAKLVSKFVQATETMKDNFADGHIEMKFNTAQCTEIDLAKAELPRVQTRSRGIQADINLPSLPPSIASARSIASAATMGS